MTKLSIIIAAILSPFSSCLKIAFNDLIPGNKTILDITEKDNFKVVTNSTTNVTSNTNNQKIDVTPTSVLSLIKLKKELASLFERSGESQFLSTLLETSIDKEGKETEQCEHISKLLNDRYYSTNEKFDNGGNSLEAFVRRNGLLLSMCPTESQQGLYPYIDHSCLLDAASTKEFISAHYIRHDLPLEFSSATKSKIGVIYRPRRVPIQCSYPISAETHQRNNNGCGALVKDHTAQDSKKPSSETKYYQHKLQLEYNQSIQQWNRSEWWRVPSMEKNWTQVSCTKLYKDVNDARMALYSDESSACRRNNKRNDDDLTFEAIPYQLQELSWNYQGFMKSPLCVPSSPTTSAMEKVNYVWTGSCSWNKANFQHMIETQKELKQMNEIVLNTNHALRDDAVLAIVLILPEQTEGEANVTHQSNTANTTQHEMKSNSDFMYDYYLARQLANNKFYQNIPLVLLDLKKTNDMFTC